MKTVCTLSLIICLSLTTVCGLSLFDIIDFPQFWHSIFGVGIIISLGIFVKTYINLKKYTSKD